MSKKTKKIVTVGGGTGSYTVLSGLKNLKNVSVTAIVAMADNGGSTGILRDELGVLPPGDVRQCLVALSDHSEIVRKLMSYRFENGGMFGHNFGNILLAALEKVTGNFAKGVEIASDIMKVKGTVVPATKNKAELAAMLSSGKIVRGQKEIDEVNFQKKGLKKIFYESKVMLNESAKKAILSADYIIIGPGNYYESLVPNFIVTGFKKAMKSTKAKIIMPVNLTNKQGHTKHWNVSDYVLQTEKYIGRKIDNILINSEAPSKEQIRRYRLKEGDGVMVMDDMKEDPRTIRWSLLSHAFFPYSKADVRAKMKSFIRHDSKKLAKCIDTLIKKK